MSGAQPNEIAAQYKFYLAIENNNCDGYVTEKLERAYQVGAVPIADGPGDYAQFDATGSAIITFDEFDNSPKKIAQYINKLGQDDELYLSRLRYKVPQDLYYTSTIKDLSNAFLRTWAMNNNLSVWGPTLGAPSAGSASWSMIHRRADRN